MTMNIETQSMSPEKRATITNQWQMVGKIQNWFSWEKCRALIH